MLRAARLQNLLQVVQGQPGVDDVFDDDDVAAFEAGVEILDQLDLAGRSGASGVARDGHEVDADLAFHRPHEVCQENERALEDADEVHGAGGKIAADFLSEREDPRREFVVANQRLNGRHGERA